MKTNTSLVPVQQSTNLIVPKPTKAQMIDVMVAQLIEQRTAENEKRAIKVASIQKKLDAAIEKFKKKTITMAELDIRWENAGALVYTHGKSFDGSPEMKALHAQKKEFLSLCTDPIWVRKEVEEKIKAEMMSVIIDQPGVKEGIKSAIAKLGL